MTIAGLLCLLLSAGWTLAGIVNDGTPHPFPAGYAGGAFFGSLALAAFVRATHQKRRTA